MPDKLDGLREIHHEILKLMMAGWQTMDHSRATGIFELDELAVHFNVPVEVMREHLEYLEVLGYVANVHSHGADQTKRYRDLDWTPKGDLDIADPHYYITENGKLVVVADLASEGGATAG